MHMKFNVFIFFIACTLRAVIVADEDQELQTKTFSNFCFDSNLEGKYIRAVKSPNSDGISIIRGTYVIQGVPKKTQRVLNIIYCHNFNCLILGL